MKQQSFARSSHSRAQDLKFDGDGHKRTASKSRQQPACDRVHKKPLAGRIFYLDLPCNKRSLTLESDIKSLGGTVEKFFSKEIGYLVSSKPDARHVQRLVQDSPVPSPDSGLSSPHPGSRRDSHGRTGSSQATADIVVVSRGKSLVEKVIRERERIQVNRILANALEWGVKILYIDDIISYVDKKKSILDKVRTVTHPVKKAARHELPEGAAFQKCKAGRIDRPFVKVEDSSRHYRPIYLQMPNMPVCNLRSAAPCSPFLVEENKENPGKKTKAHGSGGDRGERGRKERHRGREGKCRRKGGYCECCVVKYSSLKAHLESEQHQAFSKSEEYLVVDRVIAGLTCDFVPINPQEKSLKCSISSPLIIPGAAIEGEEEEELALEVDDEELTEEFAFSPNFERSLRKRCRDLSQSAKEDTEGGTLQKSQSKRGSFEWESSPDAALQNDFDVSVSHTRQDSLSDRIRRPSRVLSGLPMSQSADRVGPSELSSAGLTASCRSLCTRASAKVRVASEASVITDCKKIHFSQIFKERPPLISGHEPIRTERPSDMTHEHELTGMEGPSGNLRRRVRHTRYRRLQREASTSQSPPALCLWQLFQSSDSMEEDFKGFCD